MAVTVTLPAPVETPSVEAVVEPEVSIDPPCEVVAELASCLTGGTPLSEMRATAERAMSKPTMPEATIVRRALIAPAPCRGFLNQLF